MTQSVIDAYRAQAQAGHLMPDPEQERVAEALERLRISLEEWAATPRSFLPFLRNRRRPPPKGLYVHGSVGRGKTMLMNLFHERVGAVTKRRVHFHEFMADVHDRIAQARKSVEGDPIPKVAQSLAKEATLLCFDELHVTDIADAMILARLFSGLWQQDVVVVATSNAEPSQLYRNGLNRQLFLPFIALIEEHMEIVELDASRDFRLEKLAGEQLYFTPFDAKARERMDALWRQMSGGRETTAAELHLKGRTLFVPATAMGMARFSFSDLCEKPLGSMDYLRLAHEFHTVFIDGIPVMTPAQRNEARRFINLIDTLYDNGIGLVVSADAEPTRLYDAGDGADLFERTVSRLIEMQSESYLSARHKMSNEAKPTKSRASIA